MTQYRIEWRLLKYSRSPFSWWLAWFKENFRTKCWDFKQRTSGWNPSLDCYKITFKIQASWVQSLEEVIDLVPIGVEVEIFDCVNIQQQLNLLELSCDLLLFFLTPPIWNTQDKLILILVHYVMSILELLQRVLFWSYYFWSLLSYSLLLSMSLFHHIFFCFCFE